MLVGLNGFEFTDGVQVANLRQRGEDYAKRSHIVAIESIKIASNISENLEKKCYIVMVI